MAAASRASPTPTSTSRSAASSARVPPTISRFGSAPPARSGYSSPIPTELFWTEQNGTENFFFVRAQSRASQSRVGSDAHRAADRRGTPRHRTARDRAALHRERPVQLLGQRVHLDPQPGARQARAAHEPPRDGSAAFARGRKPGGQRLVSERPAADAAGSEHGHSRLVGSQQDRPQPAGADVSGPALPEHAAP